jgi:hypothetical protein
VSTLIGREHINSPGLAHFQSVWDIVQSYQVSGTEYMLRKRHLNGPVIGRQKVT